MKYRFTILYIALIVVVNYLFAVIPPIELPGGTFWPPVSLLVGFIFVVRDFSQREIGQYVLGAMLVGAGISAVMNLEIALASATAFLISELVDWLVYTFTKRPLSERILYSSLLSTPVDSVVFLGMIGFLSPVAVVIQALSKILGALIVWWGVRRREQAHA